MLNDVKDILSRSSRTLLQDLAGGVGRPLSPERGGIFFGVAGK